MGRLDGAGARMSAFSGAPIAIAALTAMLAGSSGSSQAWRSDRGDGHYANPVLFADYPDPDIIRVGDRFFMVVTTFANVPGITILESPDLVNWTILSHVVDRLRGDPRFDLKQGGAYRGGIYASSLRHHDGLFYIANTPVGQNTRIYSARDPRGPWTAHVLDRAAFDPGLFFDDDGTGYIVTSAGVDGTVTLLTLNRDYSAVVGSRRINYVKGAEGSKLIKRAGWYYVFNAIPSRLGMTVTRARSLDGPWETRNQIDDKTGGHQGAVVDLADGGWYGFVMRDAGAIGRTTNIGPVSWVDDWPVWGTRDHPGAVPALAAKPIPGHGFAEPAASDSFSSPHLGLQWGWNHNPDPARWSLTQRPGYLRLHATTAPEFWLARNSLTQKGQGPWSSGEARLDIRHVGRGDQCGLGTLGKYSGHIAVGRDARGNATLSASIAEDLGTTRRIERPVIDRPIRASSLWLRTTMDFRRDRATLAYSLDHSRWTVLGSEFPLAYDWRTGTFQGPQYALFCFNPQPSRGYLDIDEFRLRGETPSGSGAPG